MHSQPTHTHAWMQGVRSGNYPVVCGDHCVVLGWNRQSTSLLRKIAQNSHGSGKSLGRYPAGGMACGAGRGSW